MAEKRKRGQNFTPHEKEKLVKLLLEHKNTILNKKTDGTTNEAKLLAWTALTSSFNASGSTFRSKESLIKVWEKMKSESKVYYSTSRRNYSQTGGGPSVTKTDPILEQVCSILGRGCTGIEGVTDSDSLVLKLDESLPKVIIIGNETAAEEQIDADFSTEVCVEPEVTVNAQSVRANEGITTPLWSRRRPISSQNSERSQAMGSLCSSFKNINKKKEDVEDLKYSLLKEEFDCKKKLHELQLQAALKDLQLKDLEIEIKKAVLEKVQGGGYYTELPK